MIIPDVTGFKLKEAEGMLSGAGICIAGIEVAAPPRCESPDYNDSSRVLRYAVVGDGQVKLLVCNPDAVDGSAK